MPVPLLWKSTRWGHADDHSVIHKPYHEVLLDADHCAELLGVRGGIMHPVPQELTETPSTWAALAMQVGSGEGRKQWTWTWACDIGEGPTESMAQSGALKEE